MSSPIVVPIADGASGAVAGNFASLKADIAHWLNRTDLLAAIPGFVRMAEAEMARDTRLRSGFSAMPLSGYTSDGEIALPNDMLELKELRFAGKKLDEITFEEGTSAAPPAGFYRRGAVAVVPGGWAGQWSMLYTQKLPALVFDSDSNWLLRDGFDVYLWKCCELGSVYLRDPEAVQGYNAKYEMAVQDMQTATAYQQSGGAPLQMRAPGVV